MEYHTFTTMILLFGTVHLFSTADETWPVCFHRRSCDGRNVNVKRIDCGANENQIYKKYSSKEEFDMMNLLSDLRSSAITCGYGLLQYESHAIANSFACLNNCEGDLCPLTCEENYYTVGDKYAVCKNNNSVGRWVVNDDFECKAIICRYSDFPAVYGGQFNETDCYGNKVSYFCNMSCYTNFYTPEVKQTTCEKVGYKTGNWSGGNFSCIEILCSNDTLPPPINGTVDPSDCSEKSVGVICNITCFTNFFPTYPGYVTCENKGPPTGVWSNNSFSCFEIVCSYDTLPTPINGSVNFTDCSGISVGDICNITCYSNFFPTYPGYVTCENNGSHVGTWSNNSFSCFEILCLRDPFSSFPGNETYISNCTGYSVGDKCTVERDDDEYLTLMGFVTCEDKGRGIGQWSNITSPVLDLSAWTLFGGHYYISCATVMDWNAADSHCRSMSAHLVHINSADENSFVQSILVNSTSKYASIGLLPINSTLVDVGWKWQDNSIANYTNWGSGQPAKFEDCVGIASDGQWHDYACTAQYNCICEY